MNHIIISGFLLITSFAGHFLQGFFTSKWQEENKLIVMKAKILHGSEYTAYPKNHTFVQNCLSLFTCGSFLYLIISFLLYFFGE